MNSVFIKQKKEIELATRTHSNVLITGPTGSGKSTLAYSIHKRSARSNGPFVLINLACLTPSLIESELFGHEKGAFTGAFDKKTGLLELAHQGTVLLDEIGDMPIHIQGKLLDFLQYKTIRPIGSDQERKVNTRIIAATHQNLQKMIQEKTFRSDLFHRLNIIPIQTHSISEYPEEFNEMVQTCLEEFSKEYSKKIFGLSEEVARSLESYPWPGNIRELRNAIEYAVVSSENSRIEVSDLPHWLRYSIEQKNHLFSYQETMMQVDRDLIRQTLIFYRWKIHLAAQSLQISTSTLKRKLKKYAIHTPRDPLAHQEVRCL